MSVRQRNLSGGKVFSIQLLSIFSNGQFELLQQILSLEELQFIRSDRFVGIFIDVILSLVLENGFQLFIYLLSVLLKKLFGVINLGARLRPLSGSILVDSFNR